MIISMELLFDFLIFAGVNFHVKIRAQYKILINSNLIFAYRPLREINSQQKIPVIRYNII